MLGYLPGELEDSLDTALGLRHPDDLQGSREALRRYLNGEVDVYRSEHRMRRKDGSWAWVLERGQVVEINDDGSPLRLIGTQTDISESKAVELQLALANGNLRSLLDAATEVSIIATDLEGYILQYNAGAERMFGYSAEEMLGTRPRTLHLESEVRERCAALAQRLGRPVSDFHRYVVEVTAGRCYDEHEWTYVRKDGSQLIGNLILTEVRNEAGELIGFLGISTDITERKRVQQALEERDRLLEKLSARVPGAIYQYQLMPDGSSRFPYVSAGIHDLVEMNAPEVRQDGERVFQRVHPEDLERVQGSILASAQTLETWREDFRVLLPQKGVRWLRGESVPERMPDGSVLWHGYISDITGHKLVEQELRTLSITDALTGVYNRRHFQERLEVEIARAQRSEGPLSVLMFDIDHFKQVNDRFGHEAGDRVLKAICQRVGERLRRIDVFCRLGGEEFIVICPNTGESQVQVLADALWNTLSKEALPEVGVVTASFGLACWREGELADDLLRRVDEAVYAAKQAGRNRVCVAA
jgi:diguanylate cyclase (GGDEF)-like protein/PAS domain S-box-containing protein